MIASNFSRLENQPVIKDILIKLERDKEQDRVLDYGISVAETCDAHLAGIAFGDLAGIPNYAMPGLSSDIIAEMLAESEKFARTAIERFEAAAKRSLISVEHHLVMRSEFGPAEAFSAKARRYDLSIIQQSDEDGPNNDALIEAALFDSGRPVIVVPFIQRDGIKLNRVVVCWDGSRAAARAVNDALPLLRKAKAVEILIVANEKTKRPQREIRGIEIANHLARHNVKVELEILPAADIDVADAILSHISDTSADLLVMGGYGHSRLREFVLGGVTRDILKTMTIPAFMSH
jgi:nucleotide-binding universal stress UspA family protein